MSIKYNKRPALLIIYLSSNVLNNGFDNITNGSSSCPLSTTSNYEISIFNSFAQMSRICIYINEVTLILNNIHTCDVKYTLMWSIKTKTLLLSVPTCMYFIGDIFENHR